MDYNSPYFNPERETMSREQIEAFQLERLKETVRHCMGNAIYQKKFKEAGITPDDIQTLDDVRKIPFTTKADLRDSYPFGMACVPLKVQTLDHYLVKRSQWIIGGDGASYDIG